MYQLNWYQIFGNTHKIPDGKTVTPTDDIQIWLHCADIWDKTYTNLAEVLNDTDTLSALIASENAVDYLVRSTSWATSVVNADMTSATTPSGVVSGNYSATGDNAAWKSFDGNINTYAYKQDSSDFAYGDLRYTFPEQITVKKAVISYGYNVAMSNVHTEINAVQAYVDGEWVDLATFAYATTVRTSPTTITLTFDDFTAITDKYRLRLPTRYTSNYNVYIPDIILEAKFYSASITADSTAMSYIGLNNYAANTLIADETWCKAICRSEYAKSVFNIYVPIMTDNTHPSGVASASSIYADDVSNYGAWRAFDGNDVGGAPLASTKQISHGWFQYQFTEPVIIKAVYYKGQDNDLWASRNPSGYLQGSNDGVTYENIKAVNYRSAQIIGDAIENTNSYNRYRLYNSSSSSEYLTAATIQFYGREDV